MGFFDTIRAYFLGSACANLPPEKLAQAIVDGIAARPDAVQLSDALQVRLANQNPIAVTMYGRQVVDTLPDADPRQRLSYEIQPFAHMSTGAGCVIIAQDAAGEEYILLGTRSDGTGWGLPAGYMNSPPSFNAQGIYSQDIGHKRDAFEVALANEGKRVAGEPVNRLVDSRPAYDRTLEDTAIRETREEVGLNLRPEQLQFVHNLVADSSGKNQPHQNMGTYYLADLRAEKTLPPVAGSDDLKDPQWIKISELKSAPNNKKHSLQLRDIPIGEGVAIEKAIGQMREKEYAAFGVTKEAIAGFSHLPTPSSAIGKEAAAWHKNALSIAASMKENLKKMAYNTSPAAGYGISA